MPGSVFAPYTSITTNILFFHSKPTEETWFYRLDMPEGYKHFSKTKPMKLEHFDPVVEWWNDRQEITVDGFDKAKRFTVDSFCEELGYNLDQCGYPHEEEEILDPMDLIQRYQEERASLNAEIDRVLAEITAMLRRCQVMTPQELKNSILQLAIQGKLVEQRPEEGTAEELYQQLIHEKEVGIKKASGANQNHYLR